MANYTAKIGGSLVNVVAGQLHVENQIGQRSTGGMQIWTNLGVVYQYGTQVQVFDETNALVYAGFTTKDKIRKIARQGTGLLEHDIQLMDNCYKADKRRVFKTYLAQTAGFIVNDLLGSYLAPEGVTATTTSIASGPTITEVIWNGTKSVGEALTWLSTQSGYWWNIDVNNVLHFQPYGGVPAPIILDGTQVDATKDMSVEYGNDLYVNKQFAKGAYAVTKVLTETFHGNSLTRNWTLSYEVARLTGVDKKSGSTLGVTLNGTAQTLGSKGVDSGQPFYFAVGDAVLAQDPSNTLLTSGDTLVVTYTGRFPVLATAQNAALITAQKAREGGGTGLVESLYTNTKVHTLEAAFSIAAALLGHYGQDTTVLTFATRQKGLQPGQMLSVNLPDFSLNNKQMLISSVTISDQVDGYNVWFVVQAVGSPVESAQWQTYWQNLMNQSSDPTDFQDTADTQFAALNQSTIGWNMSATGKHTKVVCPIISNTTFCSNTTIIC